MSEVYNFFASLGVGWVNGATVISAVFGIAFSVFAFFFSISFSKKMSKTTDDEIKRTSATVEAIKEATSAIHQNSEVINKHSKILRIDNLRNLFELSKGQEDHGYWVFRWRFETFDCLRLQLKQVENEQKIIGHCEAYIQGYSNAADHLGFEGRASEFYLVKIQKSKKSNSHEFPFQDGDLLICYYRNGKRIISKGLDTQEPQYLFSIVGMGRLEMEYGETVADNAVTYPRIKDI